VTEKDPPVAESEIVAAISDAPRPVVNTNYLVGALGVPPDVLSRQLERSIETGAIEHVEIAGRLDLWWLSPDREADVDRATLE